MEGFNIHLNITQDVGHGVTIIFICCVLVVLATLIDLWTGLEAAKVAKERIRSKGLRRTVYKALDYLRVVVFGVLIDVLGLAFPWYAIPYCAILCTFGILAIEGRSVLENFRKKKSCAAEVVDMLKKIKDCATDEEAVDIIKKIRGQ